MKKGDKVRYIGETFSDLYGHVGRLLNDVEPRETVRVHFPIIDDYRFCFFESLQPVETTEPVTKKEALTLLETFALQALPGVITNAHAQEHPANIAKRSYAIAAAMLAARP